MEAELKSLLEKQGYYRGGVPQLAPSTYHSFYVIEVDGGEMDVIKGTTLPSALLTYSMRATLFPTRLRWVGDGVEYRDPNAVERNEFDRFLASRKRLRF